MNSALNGYVDDQKYYRISRIDLSLNNWLFFCLIVLNWCCSFRDKIANLQARKWLLRRFRCKRSINRGLQRLEQTNRVKRAGRVRWRLSQPKNARPVNIGILSLVRSPADCLYIRFLIYLAYYRGKSFLDITTDDIRQSLRINRNTAHMMYKWLQLHSDSFNKKHLRRRVFYSVRPAWWQYTAKTRMHKDFLNEKSLSHRAADTINTGQYYSVPQLAGHIINDILTHERLLTSTERSSDWKESHERQHAGSRDRNRHRDEIILAGRKTNNSYKSMSSSMDFARKSCHTRTRPHIADSELENMSAKAALLSGMPAELKKFFFQKNKK